MKQVNQKLYSYAVTYEEVPEGGFVAFVPLLPGCHTQGETIEETEQNIKEAIELYLESLIASGETIPEETKTFQGIVRVPLTLPA